MPVVCTRQRPPFERAGVAEHAPLLVDAAGAGVEERLGDVRRPPRIAGAEDGRGVVARLGAQVDRHGRSVACGVAVAARASVARYLRKRLTWCCRRAPCRRSGRWGSRSRCSRSTDLADGVAADRAGLAGAPVHPAGAVGGRAHVGSAALVGQALVDRVVDRGDDLRRRRRAPSLPVIANGESLARWQTSLARRRPRPAMQCWSRRNAVQAHVVRGEARGQLARRRPRSPPGRARSSGGLGQRVAGVARTTRRRAARCRPR